MGKTSQKQKEKRLAGRVSLALAAGMFSVVPVAHGANGLPTLDTSAPHTGGTPHINEPVISADGKKMTVTGKHPNNVVDWKDFSVASDNTVAFTDVNNAKANYMNIVTGVATSAIDGTITNNGDIYLINPNGVIFGKGAKVDVGNLYVSTRNADDVLIDEFIAGNKSGSEVLPVITAANANIPQADVVNLIDEGGSVKADTVVMEGRNIRFLNIGTVQAQTANADPVITLRSNKNGEDYAKGYTDGYIHVGHRSGASAGDYNVGYVDSLADRVKSEDVGVAGYTLIYDTAAPGKLTLSDITADSMLSGNYMLAEDITLTGTNVELQIGTGSAVSNGTISDLSKAFSGQFDGMFKTVSGLKQSVSDTSKYLGLFGCTNSARIENLGIANEQLHGMVAGGIVGYAYDTTLLNVWNQGWTAEALSEKEWTDTNMPVSVGPENWSTVDAVNLFRVGGLVGYLNQSTLNNAYNASFVVGGGLAGSIANHSTIQDSYNTGMLKHKGATLYGIFVSRPNGDNTNTVKNVYTASKYFHSGAQSAKTEDYTTSAGAGVMTAHAGTCFIATSDAKYQKKDTYSSFGSISNDYVSGNTWRIYEGQSLPLLTAFFKGVVSTDYDYDTYTATGTKISPTLNSLEQYASADIAGKVYDAHEVSPYKYVEAAEGAFVLDDSGAYVAYTDADAGKTRYNKVTAAYLGANADSSLITAYNHDRKDVYGNEASFALFATDQQGYDLYGNNFKITKRTIGYDAGSVPESYEKVYDGTSDAAALIKNAFAGGTTSGLCTVDEDKVSVDTSSVHADFYTTKTNTPLDANKTKNAADAHWVYISGANNITPTSKIDGDTTYNNYKVGTTSGIDGWKTGKITQRKVVVSLAEEAGIDKVYDGTEDVLAVHDSAANVQYAGSSDQASAPEGLEVVFARDNVSLSKGTASYTSQNASTAPQNVNYSGIKLVDADDSNDDLANYTLILKHGNIETEVADAGVGQTLTATGTISKRKVEISTTSVGDKVYDGNSTAAKNTITVVLKKGTAESDEEYTNAQARLILNDFVGNSASVADTFSANYVTADGTPWKNVKDSDHVEYSGVKLNLQSGVNLDNYEITGKTNGTETGALSGNATDGYNLYAGNGKITPRSLSANAITVTKSGGTANFNKIYDGLSKNDLQNKNDYTFTFKVTGADGELLTDDAGKLTLSSSGQIVYGKKSDTSFNETKDATDAGGANWVKYGVTVASGDEYTRTNYKWTGTSTSDTIGANDKITVGDKVTAGGQEATVAKRNITVQLVNETNIDKTYDGDKYVKTHATGGIVYNSTGATAGGGATGNLQYASFGTDTVLVDDGTEINILTGDANGARYSDKNVAYDSDNETPVAKDITYKVSFNDADAAKNYNLVDADTNGVLTLHADGIIKPADLTVTAASKSNDKTYDGGAGIKNTVDNTYLTVSELKGGDQFKYGTVTGRYVVKNGTQYVDASDVDVYDPAVNPGKAVEYANLQNVLVDGNGNDVSQNYKINGKRITASSTVYGKGIILQKEISSTDIANALNVKNKNIGLTMTYNGTTKYENAQNPLDSYTASDYVEFMAFGTGTGKQNTILDKDIPNIGFTIAEAVYANKNAGAFDGTDGNDVKLTFNLTGEGLKNYTITDAKADGSVDVDKDGFTGEIQKKQLKVVFANGDPTPTKVYDADTVVKANGVTFDGDFSKTDEQNQFKGWFKLDGLVKKENGHYEDIYLTTTDPTSAKVTAAYADKNAKGSDTTININYSGFEIAGTNDSTANYEFVNEIQGVGTITKRSVVVTSVTNGVDKEFDNDEFVKSLPDGFSIALSDGTDGNSIFSRETDGKNRSSITTLANLGISRYGVLNTSTGGFEKKTDVNRATRSESAKDWNVQYAGVADYLGANYELAEHTPAANDATPYWVKKDSTGNTYVYGLGKINPKEIDLANVSVQAIDKTYDGTAAVTYTNDQLKDKLSYTGGTTPAWLSRLTVSDATYEDSSEGVGDAANWGMNKKVSLTVTLPDTEINFELPDGAQSYAAVTANNGVINKRSIAAAIRELSEADKEMLTKTYDGNDNLKSDDAIATAKTFVQLDDVAEPDKGNADKLRVVVASVSYDGKNATLTDEAKNQKVQYVITGIEGTSAENYDFTSGTLSDWGEIKPKEIEFKPYDDNDSAVKFTKTYEEGNAAFTGDNDNVLRQVVKTWWESGAVAGTTGDTFESSVGELSGRYGTWSPADDPMGFTENYHVYTNGVGSPKTSDVSYSLVLTGDAASNYIIKNGTNISGTLYFKEAMQGRGEILPISITMNALKEQWEAPATKVYDGSASIGSNSAIGYKAYRAGSETPLDDVTKYLTIYYDRDGVTGYQANGTDIALPYTVTSANYNDKEGLAGKDAGDDKSFTYDGFKFSVLELGDYELQDGTVADLKTHYDGITSDGVTGSIARRVVNVVADTVSRTREYNGEKEITIPEGEHYTGVNYMGDEGVNKYSGLVGTDGAYVAYTANFAAANGERPQDVNITDSTTGTYGYKNVVYTLSMAGSNASNYELSANTATQTADSKISQITPKEVEAVFTVGEGKDLDKLYDKSSSLVGTDGKLLVGGDYDGLTLAQIIGLSGIYDGDDAGIDFVTNGKVPSADYVDEFGNVSADANAQLKEDGNLITTRKVYIQNLNLAGNQKGNYILKATKLEGEGDINQRKLELELTDAGKAPSKVYDGDKEVEYTDGTAYAKRALTGADAYIRLKAGTADGLASAVTGTTIPADGIEDVDITVDSALYLDKNANEGLGGLGVTYTLKWDNKNYHLVQTELTSNSGEIKKRTLTYKDADHLSVSKTYDGTTDVKDASAAAKGIFAYAEVDNNTGRIGDTGLVAGDEKDLLTIDASHYDSPNTGATAATGIQGTPQKVTMGFTVNSNYKLDMNNDMYDQNANPIIKATGTADANGYYRTGTFSGTGRIDRAQVTMTPTEVSYYPSQLANATYSGSASGFVNGDARPAMTFGRDGNTSTAAGNYTLLGYVNGTRIGTGDTFVDGVENYYFRTTPNTYLHILAEPVNPDVPVIPDIPDIPGIGNKPVTQAVTETVISDKKFTPDEFSYARISKDQDPTHMVRQSSASLQYSDKGVNLDGGDTKSGLAALADIQGAGSVVNLEGAFIRTSAPAEQPETVAAEAALPVPETEESDISSISLEYAGDGDNSQALLEILTNASSNAENKGTSIVIDAQDEDKEDAEEEKSRRAVFADRSNIGIETLGDAVNLNQMIG